MNSLQRLAGLFCLLLALLSVGVMAADRIEVVPLQNRSAAELMPLVRPMLNEGEALSGTGYQLILRAAPARQEEIRALIAQLDRATQTLRISVRRASHEAIERERIQGHVAIGTQGNELELRGRAIVRSTADKGDERNHFQVTALEGTPAYIHTGEAFPVPTQTGIIVNGRPVIAQGVEYQQLHSGFYALARVQGSEVVVDISPQRETLSPQGRNRIQTTSLTTTVRGRLDEWLELGGTSQQRSHQGGGLLRSTRNAGETEQTLWLKVESVE
ncbi:MAG: secretin N-terminal domain-containing protein [Thiohalobacteraceae bacterium]